MALKVKAIEREQWILVSFAEREESRTWFNYLLRE